MLTNRLTSTSQTFLLMKKLVVFILLTAFVEIVYAQNCTKPIPSQLFQQKYNQIKSRPEEQSKLNISRQIAERYCLSSSQVKEIALLFESDYDRFEFAKIAYQNTSDPENFYDVYDAFIYYSVVFKLHDYVLDKKTNTYPSEVSSSDVIHFPDYNYPPYKNYAGKKNCSYLTNDYEFNQGIVKLNNIQNENDKYNQSVNYIKQNCLATAHIMKIASLFKSEDLKYKLAKEVYNLIFDIENFTEYKQVFNTPAKRVQFLSFVNSQSTESDNQCKVTEPEYNKILSTVRNEKFNSTKLNSAKHLIQTNKCFTSEQIKGIIDLFDYENSRLDIAFLAYDFVIDQSNYYTIVSQAIGFESNKKRLLDYINNKQ